MKNFKYLQLKLKVKDSFVTLFISLSTASTELIFLLLMNELNDERNTKKGLNIMAMFIE